MRSYLNDIKSLGAGDFSMDEKKLHTYAHDASLFEVYPEAVIAPRSEADVVKVVRAVASRKDITPGLSLTARAAGTGMDGGALSESVVVDYTTYFHHIGALETVDGEQRITLEPGVMYRDLEKILTPKSLMLPSYTASKDLCTIGGMVANNSGGEYSLSYGSTNAYVRGLRVVLADGSLITTAPLRGTALDAKKKQQDFEGQIYRNLFALLEQNNQLIKKAKPRVSKNSSGYFLWDVWDGETFDLTKLFIGSQGTLGLFTSVTLGLVPIPQYEQGLVITLGARDDIARIINALRAEHPTRIEAFDENTYNLACVHMPQEARGVTTTPQTSLTIIATFSGENPEDARVRVARAEAVVRELHMQTCVSVNTEESQDYWKIRRASFQLLRTHEHDGHRVAPFIDDIIVAPEKLGTFLPELRTLLAEYFLTYTIAGHVGDGNFHIVPLVDMRDEHERRRVLELAERVFSLVFSYGGSMAGEHNDGIIRTPFVERMFGHEMYALFQETKRIFDPQGIFNPGKKVNGSLAYALEHFAKTNDSLM